MAASDTRVYLSRHRRWLISGSLVALLLASLSLLFENDPETGVRPVPSDYLWIVVPCSLLLVVLAWRALKVQVATDARGIEIVRVVGRERIPWRRLRRFEVHPTPGRQGSVVLARRDDEVLVKVWTEIVVRPVRDRDQARGLARARAEALADELEQDRTERQAALSRAVPHNQRPADPSPSEGRAG